MSEIDFELELVKTSVRDDLMLGMWIVLACTSVLSLILALIM